MKKILLLISVIATMVMATSCGSYLYIGDPYYDVISGTYRYPYMYHPVPPPPPMRPHPSVHPAPAPHGNPQPMDRPKPQSGSMGGRPQGNNPHGKR